MGYRDFDAFGGASGANNDLGTSANNKTVITVDSASDTVDAPAFVKDADFAREGSDLILTDKGGAQTLVIEGYFAQAETPTIIDADGAQFSPALVQSFLKATPTFAYAETMSDVSPIGAVHEITGDATVTRTNGMTEPLKLGTPVYQGDIVETAETGAVNIMFIDETSMAISEDARLAIDEYVFDPSSSGGVSNFSVLKGIFVYTSGLIGRDDPDDVLIETPIGSIGIRGTIIAADVDNGEVTVVEGAIVLRDATGNEMTLASQYETARFNTSTGTIDNLGQLSPQQMLEKFVSVSSVAGELFSSVNDNITIQAPDPAPSPQQNTEGNTEQQSQENTSGASGSVDQSNDGRVDGTVEESQERSESGNKSSNASEDGSNSGEGAEQSEESQEDEEAFNETTFGTESSLEASEASASSSSRGSTSEKGSSSSSNSNSNSSKGSGSSQGKGRWKKADATENLDPAAVNEFVVTSRGVSELREGESGLTVGNISTSNGHSIQSVSFNGPFGAMFEYIATSRTSGTIRLREGFDLDFETFNFLNLQYQATSATGAVFNGVVPITVTDVDEAPYIVNTASSITMSAIEGMNWSYDFRNDFRDSDLDSNLTFTYEVIVDEDRSSILSAAELIFIDTDSVLEINENGLLNVNFLLDGIAQTNFTLIVTAQDSNDNTISNTYEFELYGNRASSSSSTIDHDNVNIFVNPSAGSAPLNIEGNNNTIFISDIFTGTMMVAGNGNTIRGGNDTYHITVEGSGNSISGGNTDNIFTILNGNNHFYGDGGNDVFTFNSASSYNSFANGSSSSSSINGGSEGFYDQSSDTENQTFTINFGQQEHMGLEAQSFTGYGDKIRFSFDTGEAIDLSVISDRVTGIEILDFRNGTDDNISLSYHDLVNMTDDRNTLVIRGDSGDSLSFDISGFENLVTGTQITDLALEDTQYNSYFIGDVTILVETGIGTEFVSS
ncbi:MAG: FecR domain-containing protein [Alphaproteobacteria bacterium]